MDDGTKTFVTAGHVALFEDDDGTRCEVCSQTIEPDEEDGFEVAGHGLLVWTRGEERRTVEPPLCPSCAAAIGVSALHRWEIEEEEG